MLESSVDSNTCDHVQATSITTSVTIRSRNILRINMQTRRRILSELMFHCILASGVYIQDKYKNHYMTRLNYPKERQILTLAGAEVILLWT